MADVFGLIRRSLEAEEAHQKAMPDDQFEAVLNLLDSPHYHRFLYEEKVYLGQGDFDGYPALEWECIRWCRENLESYWDLNRNARMRFWSADDAIQFMLRWW